MRDTRNVKNFGLRETLENAAIFLIEPIASQNPSGQTQGRPIGGGVTLLGPFA